MSEIRRIEIDQPALDRLKDIVCRPARQEWSDVEVRKLIPHGHLKVEEIAYIAEQLETKLTEVEPERRGGETPAQVLGHRILWAYGTAQLAEGDFNTPGSIITYLEETDDPATLWVTISLKRQMHFLGTA